VIVCTKCASVPQAVRAAKLGAFDYAQKSTEPPALTALRTTSRGLYRNSRRGFGRGGGSQKSWSARSSGTGFYGIISQNALMRDMFELIQTIADSFANILVPRRDRHRQGTRGARYS